MLTLGYEILDDDTSKPVLVLGNALGTTSLIWASVANRLSDNYRIILVDLPGHGVSPAASDFTLAGIADAVAALVPAQQFAYAGVSISGAIGFELALRFPDRLSALIACGTSDRFGQPEDWYERIEAVRAGTTRAQVPDCAELWFADGFLDEDNASGSMVLAELARTEDRAYISCCEALSTYDLRSQIALITVPTLFLAGSQDIMTSPELMGRLHAELADSGTVRTKFRVIPDSAHLPMVEHPDLFSDILNDYLNDELQGA